MSVLCALPVCVGYSRVPSVKGFIAWYNNVRRRYSWVYEQIAQKHSREYLPGHLGLSANLRLEKRKKWIGFQAQPHTDHTWSGHTSFNAAKFIARQAKGTFSAWYTEELVPIRVLCGEKLAVASHVCPALLYFCQFVICCCGSRILFTYYTLWMEPIFPSPVEFCLLWRESASIEAKIEKRGNPIPITNRDGLQVSK